MKEAEEEVMVCDEVEEAALSLNSVMNEVGEVLVERETEIAAFKLCLITKQHLMLEGPPGIAKSMLADEVFSHLRGKELVVFKKQLMANTQTDEIFGPLDATKYREDADYVVKVEGYLPSAHFAFLDEVYRAANMILPAILGILNERTFQNGVLHLTCPLRTAIGTSNFTSDNPELEAFHDRWLIRVKSEPLSNSSSRLKALKRYLSWDLSDKPRKAKVSLDDLDVLHEAMKLVTVPDDVYTLYEEMVVHLRKAIPNVYISDRRFCQAFRLSLASHVSAESDEDAPAKAENNLDAAMLYFARFGLITVNNREQTDAFESVYGSVVGSYAENITLNQKIKKVFDYARKLENDYDEDDDANECSLLYVKTKRALSGLENAMPQNLSTMSSRIIDLVGQTRRKLEGLEQTILPKVDMKKVGEIVERMKAVNKS